MSALCNCRSWCRDPHAETQNGRFPQPNHAPGCNAYALETFTAVSVIGAGCILEPAQAERVLADSDDPTQYEQTTIELTRDQFDRMEEFQGW